MINWCKLPVFRDTFFKKDRLVSLYKRNIKFTNKLTVFAKTVGLIVCFDNFTRPYLMK